MAGWIEKLTGDLGEKKRYREYKARVKSLPEGYRTATDALERYVLNLGPTGDSTQLLQMLDDLADLMEQGAAAGTPVRELLGENPAEFAETFMENYGGGSWIRKERSRLAAAVEKAANEQAGGGGAR
jgi:DNA-binding ferritin-like protein (Dps family)